MQPEYPSSYHRDNGNVAQDRATAILLTGGFNDGVSAFSLRHWHPGVNPPEPVFVTWLLDVGRFCLTVKYGCYSLKGEQWRVDTGSGLRIAPSPLEQAKVESLLIGEILQERLNRPITVVPALALFDTDPTGASSAWPTAAVFRCSGTWRATRVSWLTPRPEAGSASPCSGGMRWRRYRRSWRAFLRPAPSRPQGPGWVPVRVGFIGGAETPSQADGRVGQHVVNDDHHGLRGQTGGNHPTFQEPSDDSPDDHPLSTWSGCCRDRRTVPERSGVRNGCCANQIEYQYVCTQRDDHKRLPPMRFDGEQPRSESDAKLSEPSDIGPSPVVAGFLERSFERSHR